MNKNRLYDTSHLRREAAQLTEQIEFPSEQDGELVEGFLSRSHEIATDVANARKVAVELPKLLASINKLDQSSNKRAYVRIWSRLVAQIKRLYPKGLGEVNQRFSRIAFADSSGVTKETSDKTLSDSTRRLQHIVAALLLERLVDIEHDHATFAFDGISALLCEEMEKLDESTCLTNRIDAPRTEHVEVASHALSQVPQDHYLQLLQTLGTESCQALFRGLLNLPAIQTSIDQANPGLGTVARQLVTEGAASLTRDELRKLQTFAANRLKEADFDERVNERAIADDIFPHASLLFPDRIKSPSDVNPISLTTLFREKSEDPTANANPLSETQLLAIRDLSQAWRKHFQHPNYRGDSVNVSLAGPDGLFFRQPGRGGKSRGTSKFWPKLEFEP